MRRFLGAAFAVSSLVTPYFLGAVVGGVASGRVPPGIATGDVVTSWVNPTSALGGVLAVLTCAYLAAVFLCLDARARRPPRARGRVPASGRWAPRPSPALVGLGGLFVLRADAPQLADGLFGRALPVVTLSVLAGLASIVLLVLRRYAVARVTSSLAVAAILLGWAAGPVPVRAAAATSRSRTPRRARPRWSRCSSSLVVGSVRARARARLPLPALPTSGNARARRTADRMTP